MAYYTILNFEDANTSPAIGRLVTGSKNPAAWQGMGAGAAAQGTAMVYQRRALRDSKMFDKKRVVYYPCQELITRDAAGALKRDDISQIREDCRKSKTIAFVIHGKPSDTDQGFSTTGAAVCGWDQLGKLAKLILPSGERTYNIALIMCYGARSSASTLDHEGMLSEGDVKSSFAYKFFRSICVARNVRLSAWTGAVSNDASMMHTVEREGEVMVAIEKQVIQTQRSALRPSGKTAKEEMEDERDDLIATGQVTKPAFDVMVDKFANAPMLPPANAVEAFAKSFVIYSSKAFRFAANLHAGKPMFNASKYGKFVYSYTTGVFTVQARYATGHHGPNHILFSGALT